MDTPSTPRHANGPRYALNGLVFALIVCAVVLGATAGWMCYSKKRACGFQDAAYQAMGAMLPEFCPIGGVIPGGAASRFICPQCSSYCWTQVRAGCPLCPFCKQAMVQDAPVVVPAGGVIPGGTASRFICPQCSSYCWTQVRAGCPLCPICRQPMVPEVTGVAPAAGPTAAAAAGGFAGRMGGMGLGPGGLLVCPGCGTTIAHQRGVPCFTVACPSCGTTMTRAQ